MSNRRNDDEFVHEIKRLLDNSVENLDVRTTGRLRAARREALAGRAVARPLSRWEWLPASGMALATLAILLIWNGGTAPPTDVAFIEDLEVLVAEENPDFYAELDFYQWLDEVAEAG